MFLKSLKSFFFYIDLHASKHINFSITNSSHIKKFDFRLIRILLEIDFVLPNFQCQNVQTSVGGGGMGPNQYRASYRTLEN